jgi:acyl-CoA thioester hydrolase
MARIHLYPVTVGEDAIDVLKHVNNLTYLRWTQDAALSHSTEQGWPVERYLANGAGWVVKSHYIDYAKPSYLGESLRIYTWVSAMSESSSSRHTTIIREQDGQVVARAETRWVYIDYASARPTRIPDDVRAAFDIVDADDSELRLLVGQAG